MSENLISRIRVHRQGNVSGDSVIYLMSRDQRVDDNHALIAAQKIAITKKLPLIVAFHLYPSSGVRAVEHYDFMLKGLSEVATELCKLNINLVVTTGSDHEQLLNLIQKYNALDVICDFSPLSGPQKRIDELLKETKSNIYEVDTHNIIPVWVLSDKQEFAAHTIRRKVHQKLKNYLIEPDETVKHPYSLKEGLLTSNPHEHMNSINAIKRNIVFGLMPGAKSARDTLTRLKSKLSTYALERNDPNSSAQSDLSPYLHFGQISSLRVALDLIEYAKAEPLLNKEAKLASAGDVPSLYDGLNALLEEMIVRKELSDNFCYYSSSYKSLRGAPAWAQKTLLAHAKDKRQFVYTRDQLENSKTHDPAWNAAQNQLTKSGKIHGYMRMYWAKKILEWTETPQQAIDFCIYLNDAYSIDGGDPNGYAGILWSIAGLHDRPWFERQVYGSIRYMNGSGLARKFDLDKYIKTWS